MTINNNPFTHGHHGALAGQRHRVVISTDIGGSDPDDFQSLVHYLVYSDLFDTEGLISSPWGDGRASHILEVLQAYEKDYDHLQRHSSSYPEPDSLRDITKQGAVHVAPDAGYRGPTEGSEWLIACAKRPDPRPLYVLIWGTIEDLAQALHDAPEIKSNIRVYYIAGPNKKWGVNAHRYIEREHSDLWIIENSSTYRGLFVGGDQSGPFGNQAFVTQHVAGHGALGQCLVEHLPVWKAGDSPSVLYLLQGWPENPERPSWGGRFAPVNSRPFYSFDRLTGPEDRVEVFGVLELQFRGPVLDGVEGEPQLFLVVREQRFPGYYIGCGRYRVRFAPKNTGLYSYHIESRHEELSGLTGQFSVVPENPERRGPRQGSFSRWWSDVLDPELYEGPWPGARTVSRWRRDILSDLAPRLDRCLR